MYIYIYFWFGSISLFVMFGMEIAAPHQSLWGGILSVPCSVVKYHISLL